MSVVEPALPAPLFARLARAVRALGREGLRTTYRTTFWFDLGAPAALPEAAALAVRARLGARLRGAAGVEWWLSRAPPSAPGVDFHLDRDEVLFARAGRTRHPAVTSVLFLGRCRGGHLAVTAQPPDPANPSLAPLPLSADLVRPWPNRLAVLRGDLTHGVLDDRGELPVPGRRVDAPLRLALVLNWWRARPEGVPTFAQAGRYPTLRLAAPRPGAR